MAATFTGKYAFRSTNASGPTCYLRIQSRDGDSLAPVMNGTAPPATAPDERFMTYDAGGGARTLVTVAELTGALWYGYVDEGTGWLFMVDTAAGATPIRWSSTAGDRVTWTYTAKNGHALSMRYTVGGDESSLIFRDLAGAPGGPAPQLSEFSCVELAPGVPKMRETKLAKGGDFQHVDLTGADLSGIDFTGADFRGAILTGAKFPDATLTNAKFPGATLSGVTFERTTLDGADLTGVDLRGVIWRPPFTARKTVFAQCSAAGARLAASDPKPSADLTGADLSRADFTGANLANLTLEGATLDGTSLVGATLDGANLSRAIIRSVNLTDASLVGAKMAGVQSVVVRFTLTAPGDVSAMVGYLDGDDTRASAPSSRTTAWRSPGRSRRRPAWPIGLDRRPDRRRHDVRGPAPGRGQGDADRLRAGHRAGHLDQRVHAGGRSRAGLASAASWPRACTCTATARASPAPTCPTRS